MPNAAIRDNTLRRLYSFLFKLSGWKIKADWPVPYKKYVLIVAPHTSNWDFLIGVGARAVLNFNPRFAAKKELFVWPIGWLFRKLGGYPVERKANTNFVQNLVDVFNREESFILTITPEGTRSYNDQWKTGFYYLAQDANIPIIPIAFDYRTKTIVMHDPVWANEPIEKVIENLKRWYSQFEGKNPSLGVFKRHQNKDHNQ
ncbi:MAG: 1-acyl-sn-glycerol-3-phosphate acyltransferase [bacterium]|jgi:1-acyl-sn-glycerol-3-phosphate acyltransferase